MKISNFLKLGALLVFSTSAIYADDHMALDSTVASTTVASGAVAGSTLPNGEMKDPSVDGTVLPSKPDDSNLGEMPSVGSVVK